MRLARATSSLYLILSVPFGVLTGAAAGLIGVGGGEFRVPFLMAAYRHRVKTAAAVNLVVGLITVALAIYRRMANGGMAAPDWLLVTVLVVCSTLGSVIGARVADVVRSDTLRGVIIAYLAGAGAWMLYESFSHQEHALLHPGGTGACALGAIIGLLVGFLSPMFGIAGGEMRIPALMYLLAMPVKEAGLLSLIASLPTVAAGAITYRRLGHLDMDDAPLACLLGIGSVIGVLAGVAVLPHVDAHALKGILGVVLMLAAGGLVMQHSNLDRNTENRKHS